MTVTNHTRSGTTYSVASFTMYNTDDGTLPTGVGKRYLTTLGPTSFSVKWDNNYEVEDGDGISSGTWTGRLYDASGHLLSTNQVTVPTSDTMTPQGPIGFTSLQPNTLYYWTLVSGTGSDAGVPRRPIQTVHPNDLTS